MAPFIDVLQRAGQAVLATFPFIYDHPIHKHESLPDLNVTITPKYLEPSQVSSLDIQMIIAQPDVQHDHSLVSMILKSGNVPTCRYDGDALTASDAQGLLSLNIEDEDLSLDDPKRTWITTRNTVGDVVLSFEAFPREVNTSTPPGPRIELAKDQGGLMGSGLSFLPLPTDENATYNINLVWNFEMAPPGIRAVWAFGEGNTSRIGPAADLGALYAIGPVRSYTIPEKDYGMYWFGETPFDSTALAKRIGVLLYGMLEFFQESEPTFRVFVRKSIHRSFGGSGSLKSFCFEYDNIFFPANTLDSLLAHELVHEWPLLDSGNDVSRGIKSSVAWYDEGIAVYYQAILTYRFGVFDRHQFLHELNTIASAYYTSPAIQITDDQAEKLAWENTHAQRIPYYRGGMFLFKLAAELQAGGKRSLDHLVLDLLKLKYARKPYGLEQWLPLVEAELGNKSTADFKDMLAGKMVIPPSDCLAYEGLKLVRRDQERYELGYDEISASKGVIVGLKPGSRAEAAGLKEGDVLEKSHPIWYSADYIEERHVVTVVRGDKTVNIEYWPRTWDKVESYQWVEDEDHEL